MKKNSGNTVRYDIDLDNLPPLTEAQKAELAALSALPDDQIDFSELPPLSEERLKNASRGSFYRPIKQQITARIDADVLDWLKSQGKGYQVRMNAILRREMLAATKSRQQADKSGSYSIGLKIRNDFR